MGQGAPWVLQLYYAMNKWEGLTLDIDQVPWVSISVWHQPQPQLCSAKRAAGTTLLPRSFPGLKTFSFFYPATFPETFKRAITQGLFSPVGSSASKESGTAASRAAMHITLFWQWRCTQPFPTSWIFNPYCCCWLFNNKHVSENHCYLQFITSNLVTRTNWEKVVLKRLARIKFFNGGPQLQAVMRAEVVTYS